jgi:hypothetical protein
MSTRESRYQTEGFQMLETCPTHVLTLGEPPHLSEDLPTYRWPPQEPGPKLLVVPHIMPPQEQIGGANLLAKSITTPWSGPGLPRPWTPDAPASRSMFASRHHGSVPNEALPLASSG